MTHSKLKTVLVVTTLLTTCYSSSALARAPAATAAVSPIQTPEIADQPGQTVRLLDEVAASRGAIRRGEPKVAAEILSDASRVLRVIDGTTHPVFSVLGAVNGEDEQVRDVTLRKGAPNQKDDTLVVVGEQRFTRLALLDLKIARTDLAEARAALAAGKTERASSLLGEIEDGVIVVKHTVSRPMAAAHDNLRIAWKDLRDGNWQGADRAYQEAIRDAKTFRASVDAAPTTKK
jgi:hypothetical protein